MFKTYLSILMAISVTTINAEEAKKFDSAAILGSWSYEAGAKAGQELGEDRLRGNIEISKETITLLSDAGKFVIAYKISDSASLAKIDMTMTESPFGAGAKTKGLIEMRDGKVVLGYVPSEGDSVADYPAKLVSTAENGLHLFRLKRRALTPAEIVGKWLYVSSARAGDEAAGDKVQTFGDVVITEKTITLNTPDGKFVMDFSINSDDYPAKLDLTITESPIGTGAKAKGRIELRDGRLAIAYDPDPNAANYPDGFKSSADNKLHVFHLKKP